MAGELLADSDFFIALYKRGDANHERALRILEKMRASGKNLASSVFVYSEVATVLSQRVSRETARNFMNDMEESGVRIIQGSEAFFEKTREIFCEQRSKNVSFTDASNIALVRMGGFEALVSFDADYKKNGVKIFSV